MCSSNTPLTNNNDNDDGDFHNLQSLVSHHTVAEVVIWQPLGKFNLHSVLIK